ncbi:MAG: flagellar export protein FliJ [Gammaproteobacteria bacterium]|nr:flagellar export protein FliJ [Gammaproteobacteria bacterium]
MSKKRTQKIDKVVSLAASEERRFGEITGRSQQTLNEQLLRLGELNAYRQGYAAKRPSPTGVSAVHWRDYQNFLGRLDTAVSSQQQIIRDCEQNLEVHRNRWLQKRQKLESLERVLEKSRQQDAAYESRLEQKMLDDLPRSELFRSDGEDG